MKLYIISGLGGNEKILDKIDYPENIVPIYLEWLVPEKKESLASYIKRLAKPIDDSEEFSLLGYSYGGYVVQEIQKIKSAKKVIIMACMRYNDKYPFIARIGKILRLPYLMHISFFREKSIVFKFFFNRLLDVEHVDVLNFFQMRHPYFLKWNLQKMIDWDFVKQDNTIQVMGEHDKIYPLKNSKPDYVIKGMAHYFPITKPKLVSSILDKIFCNLEVVLDQTQIKIMK